MWIGKRDWGKGRGGGINSCVGKRGSEGVNQGEKELYALRRGYVQPVDYDYSNIWPVKH